MTSVMFILFLSAIGSKYASLLSAHFYCFNPTSSLPFSSSAVCGNWANKNRFLLTGVYSEVAITVQPSMDDGFITWSQTVTISCNWTPPESGRLPQADILADGISVFSDAMYKDDVNQEGKLMYIFN